MKTELDTLEEKRQTLEAAYGVLKEMGLDWSVVCVSRA